VLTTRFWHPFANMAQVAGDEVVFDRGDGVWLVDEGGRRYLDATAALWYCNVGHGREELADRAASQMRRLAACSNFDRLANRPALDLAERISALAPIEDGAVFFTSGGSESIDTAVKLVRHYWAVVGQPTRQLIVVREHAQLAVLQRVNLARDCSGQRLRVSGGSAHRKHGVLRIPASQRRVDLDQRFSL
jgi:adenosylmethionine-8-amino-7-oxononanoate aminotransferase